MRAQRQADDRHSNTREPAPPVPHTERANAPGPGPRSLLALQRSAGNAATGRALRQDRAGEAAAAGPAPDGEAAAAGPAPDAAPQAAGRGSTLPPYLLRLEAPGLSSASGLTGHEFVKNAVAAAVGRTDGTVADIGAELAGRPESFYGQGRAFSVQGAEGRGSYDVTVTIGPSPGEQRPEIRDPATTDPEGAATKVDVHRNSAATVGTGSGGSSSRGAGGLFFGLAPVVPGVWLGGAGTAQAQPWQSSQESRSQKSVAHPRVLRSDGGSAQVPRRVRYGVRVKRQGADDAQTFHAAGTLTMRVPTEHLVPYDSPDTTAPLTPRRIDDGMAKRVRHAGSLAPVAVTDSAAAHQGGGGLFDAVASVLHPTITAPGAPGRARLYETTSTTTVLEDMPRLLGDGVVSEDLQGKDTTTVGSYRMKARIAGLAPAWGSGRTQLRTHQHAQQTVTDASAKGRSGAVGLGPAAGFGVLANAAAFRGTVMPTAAARKARFTVNEQTVAGRQGAEIRGDKVLYLATVELTAEGTGTRSVAVRAGRADRVARHTMRMWMSLRADEAHDMGLPLPPGMEAGEFLSRPKRKNEDAQQAGPGATAGRDGTGSSPAAGIGAGVEAGIGADTSAGTTAGSEESADVERHLPFGAMGSSVALDKLDTGPMIAALERMFALDPRLAGYLPSFGAERERGGASREEAEAQRQNYRELVTTLSEANLRTNKDQLLSTGVPARLRRKSTMHAHDVHIRVTGKLGTTTYLGDTENWLVRSHSGVSSNLQSGRSSSRSVGGTVLGQVRIVPGALALSARLDKEQKTSRRNQAGPTTRTDVLTNGSEHASTFAAPLSLNVHVTMTSRPRKLARTVLPGSPGRDVVEPESLHSMDLEEQDVRLATPTEFTLGQEEKERLDKDDVEARKTKRQSRTFDAEGIGDLAARAPSPGGDWEVPDWTLVETVGDGQPIRDLAFELLARAAAGDKGVREDTALQTQGLAPRLAIEERLSPQAVRGALRQAVSSGWVVKNLRYPRRLAALSGAVGTRLALANPRLVHEGAGPGTETTVLGGHQAAGQTGRSTTTTVQGGAMGMENGAGWRTGQGVSVSHRTEQGTTDALAMSGSVERNAHTPRKAPLYLVRCDLLVNMIAEVRTTGGGPYVTTAGRTLPATAAVWLTAEQLWRTGLDLPESAATAMGLSDGPLFAAGLDEALETASRRATGTADQDTAASPAPQGPPGRSAAPVPSLASELPLGLGLIENLPSFLPLLTAARDSLRSGGHPQLADALLPRQQANDPNDNVLRLLRVLDRDGSAGLLSGAMDGGVTVELFDGRRTPYWAVFRVYPDGPPGTFAKTVSDGRDMEYITSATAQQSASQEEGSSLDVQGVAAAAGRPEASAGMLKTTGGVLGLGVATADSRRSGSVSRTQVGMKLVAPASSSPAALMRLPINATLEIHSAGGRVALAKLGRRELVQRLPVSDVQALAGLQPVTRLPPAARTPLTSGGAPPEQQLGPWRADGVRLPQDAQVNGFRGAPQVRQLVAGAVREAGGGDRYQDKGQTAAYTLHEAVSTEWMISALPLLTSAGADLPPVHAGGARGQDLRASLHARLRAARLLGVGGEMSFESVAPSSPEGPRPTQADGQQAVSHEKTGRGLFGAGLLNATDFRLNQLLGNVDSSAGATDITANGSGSMPVHKPKQRSALVQFTVDLRVVARVTRRGQHRSTTAVRELTLPMPVVVRMPEPAARRMLADSADSADATAGSNGSDAQGTAAPSVPGVPQP